MLLREHSSCLCRGENGKSFCLAELWPALIVRIHWDFTINAVHAFQNTKKNYFGFTHEPLKFISSPRKDKLMTADDSIKCRCANSGMTDQVLIRSTQQASVSTYVSKGFLFSLEACLVYLVSSCLKNLDKNYFSVCVLSELCIGCLKFFRWLFGLIQNC